MNLRASRAILTLLLSLLQLLRLPLSLLPPSGASLTSALPPGVLECACL